MPEGLLRDVGYALRFLRRNPGFALVAVLSLGVGIGFNTALFSVVDALVLRPLPVAEPDRLVDIYTSGADGDTYATSSYPDYLDFRAETRSFADVAGHSAMFTAQNLEDRSRLLLGEVVTGNFFTLLGLRAAAGRTLLPDDDRPGAERVVVISHRKWQRDFHGDPAAVGRSLRLRGQSYAIVGIAPAGFSGMLPMLAAEIWLPMAHVEEVEPAGIQDAVPSPTGSSRLERRGQRFLFLKARLQKGVSVEEARAALALVGTRLEAVYPQTNRDRKLSLARTRDVRVHPEADRVIRPVASAAMALVGLVLLIACANVASLLLARAAARRREIGIRVAIGADRATLVRQLLTESLVLALAGGAFGCALAWAGTRALTSLALPIPIPMSLDLRVDWRVLLFALAASLGAGLVAGLAPALRASRPDVASELRGERSSSDAPSRRFGFRDGLVAAQIAVTFALLLAAGLVTRSLSASLRAPLGFEPDGIAIVSLDLDMLRYDATRSREFYERASERIAALPGVSSVARAWRLPFSLNFGENQFDVPGHESPTGRGFSLLTTDVSPGYFETLRVPLLEGRDFAVGDTPDAPRVAIVNETMARRFWPGESAVGKTFRRHDRPERVYQVVGVVADYKTRTIGEAKAAYIHFAAEQQPSPAQVVFARTRGDAAALVAQMRRVLTEMEPNLVFLDNQTMQAQVRTILLPVEAGAWLSSVAGVVALALAAFGLYGTVAYSVARRTREFGVRMALGADRARLVRLVLRHGLALAAIGLVAGGLAAALLARVLSGALYGVAAADPVAWLGAASLALAAALTANALPALRASRVHPSEALRVD
jgi:predicted permease